MCPGNNELAGKRRRAHGRTCPRAAAAAGRTKTFLGARYHRVRSGRGSLKANKALAHSVVVAVFQMHRDDRDFSDLGVDFFECRRPEHGRVTCASGFRLRVLLHRFAPILFTIREYAR